MLSSDSNFRQGENITIEVSNKPYVDFSIPPMSNNYRWVDFSNIKIYCPPDNILYQETNLIDLPNSELVVDAPLKINPKKVGWYFYRYQLPCTAPIGVWKVIISLSSFVPIGVSTDSTSICTTGAPITGTPITGAPLSGDQFQVPDGYELATTVSVQYFRVLQRTVF